MGDETNVWRPSKEKYGVAVCNFSGEVKHGLPLSTGDTVHILEVYSRNDEAIWYRGCSLKTKNKMGIFPAAFICTKPCKVDNEGPYESITPIEDQTALEVSYVLREWSVLWKEAFVMNIYSCSTQQHVPKRRKSIFYVSNSNSFQDQKGMWHNLHNIMMDLISMRRTLLADIQTQDNCQELKMKITHKIDWGNKTLSLDLVPRLDGEQVDADNISIVQLYRIHKESDSSLRDLKSSKHDRESNDGRMLNIANILVNFKAFPSSLNEDKELYFSIYDANETKFISERFLVLINDQGIPQPIEKLNNCYGLFLDLPLEKDLWLVVQIYRIGKMLTSDTSKKSNNNKKFRRPYGVTVCSLKEINQAKFSHDEPEVTLKVTSVDKEELFHNLHDSIIRRALQRIPTSEKNLSGLYIGLQLLFGDLPFLKSTNPIPFNKGVELVQQCSFPESLLPGDVRNDLYIVLSQGEFERGNKTSAKNVEVTMRAFDSTGELIPDCIYRGISEPPSSYYHSTVFYHSNNPKWKETVKFTLPIEKFTGAHIRLELRHCSTSDKKQGENLLGFSFIKITNQDITLTDATHTLCIYKCDNLVNLTCMDYLNLPQSPSETSTSTVSTMFQRNSRDNLTISSCLCSTKFTQNKDLLDILQWRMKTDKIEKSLEKLMTINGRDIVRYLHDILDALFDMSCTESLEKYNQVVFDALVHVFYLLTNRTFKQYVPGFLSYLTDTFSSSLVYRHLLLCLKTNLDKIINGSQDRILKEMLKVFNYLFQFIVQSKLLFNRAYNVEITDDFPQLIYYVFEKMGYLVSLNQDNLSSCQILLLSNIPNTYNSLLKLLSKKDVTIYVVNIINFMPKELSESLFSKKLEFLHETLKSELVTDRDSRMMLLPVCMSQIKRCFIGKQLYSLATTILGDILCFLHSLKLKDPESVSEEIRIVITAIFQVVLRAIDVYDTSGAVVSCFVEMLRIMDDDHYTALFQAYAQGIPLRDFLNQVLVTFHNLINLDTFPCDWSVMRMVMNNVILTSIHYFARALSDNFLQDSNFEYHLWNNYFHLAVSFIIQPSLQLENFSIAKSQKIKERYQDMRVLLGFQVQTLWQDLDDYKFHFIPYLVGPFLEVTLVPDKELRKATLPILFDMMECEMKLSKSFEKVEKEMFEKLDLFITTYKGDAEYKELFHDILMEKVQAEPKLQQSGSQFILSISNLMEKLLDYRQYIDKEDNKDKRMHCTYNILNFYKTEVNKEELYIRYIHKLYELHLNTDSFVEAGLTLQLYSCLLDWSENTLLAEMDYHSELQWERKEKLYVDIIDCFDKGKAWEYGIPLCKELASHYETKLYDYRKLSEILQKEAKFFENILDGQFLRQDPSYYRVAYFGQTFPKFLRNKVFIYRGDEYLKLQMIMSHLTTEFQNATILIHNNPPDETMKQGDQQYIQISCVKPFKTDQDLSNPSILLGNPSIPREVKSFYQVNEVDTFLYDRPYHRTEKDKNNEFKTLCIERSIIKTVEKLPGILRWYEVESIDVENLTPIEGAIDLMKQTTKDLIIQIEKCQIKPTTELTLLSMKLRGTINATVNGGIAKYQEAFFTQEFATKYPNELKHLEELKAVMLRQLQVLENGLTLHGSHVTEDILPLHKTMEDNLVILKKNIKQAITGSPSFGRMHQTPSNRLDLFDDRPSTPSTGSIHSNSSNRSSTLSADTGFHDEDNSFNIYSEAKEKPEPSKTPSPSPGAVSLPTTPLDQKTSTRRVSESEIHHRPSPPPLPHRLPLFEDSKLKASPNGPSLHTPPVVPPKTPKVIDISKITAPPPLPPRKTIPTTPITPEVPSEYRFDKAPPLPRRLNNN